MSEPRTIPLSAIVGRSRFNVRPEGDPAGRDAMAASIRAMGQLQALIVRAEGTPGLFEVDDGGCRWDAMCQLVALDEADPPDGRKPWAWNTDVNVLVVNGDAGMARERSLAANVIRRNLHPVEECEAFSDMVRDGVAVETIAADFGVTARYVRQRLKLDELSQRARAAWRDNKLSAAGAEVLTGAKDHAAQDAILDRYPQGLFGYAVDAVRRELRQHALRGDAPEARFVGVECYVANGGALDEQLFDTEPLILDPVLMKRLARQAMVDEGLRVAERFGFGSVIIPDELPEDERGRWGRLSMRLNEAEQAEVDRLNAGEAGEIEALPDEVDEAEVTVIQERYAALEEAVEQRAIERNTTETERLAAAVFVSLNHSGELVVDLGRTRPKPKSDAEAQPAASSRPFAATTATTPAPASAEPVKAPGKALVAVMDEAMSKAYAAIVAERPYLAMMLATAALTAIGNHSALRIRASVRKDSQRGVLDFTEAAALALTGLQGREDVMLRFARAVAATIDVAPASSLDGGRHSLVDAAALAELITVYGDGRYHAAMVAALDYRAYFEAATKAATLAAIEETGGDLADARKLGKLMLVEAAATLCRDRVWLPPELRKPDTVAMRRSIDTKLPMEMPSIADAMAAALAADGEDLDAEAAGDAPEPLVFDPQTPDEAIADFLRRHCLRDDERYRIKAQVLFDAFQDRMPQVAVDLLPTFREFGDAVAAAGIAKKRLAAGVHYLGLDLRAVAPLKQAAE